MTHRVNYRSGNLGRFARNISRRAKELSRVHCYMPCILHTEGRRRRRITNIKAAAVAVPRDSARPNANFVETAAPIRPRKRATASLGQVRTRARHTRAVKSRRKERGKGRKKKSGEVTGPTDVNPGSSLRIERLRAGPIPRERTGDLVSGVSNASGGWESDERPDGGEGARGWRRGVRGVYRECPTKRFYGATARSASFLRTWIRRTNARRA